MLRDDGRWLSSLLLNITPPDFYSDACTIELVCPAALLKQTQRERSSQIFAERPHSRFRASKVVANLV